MKQPKFVSVETYNPPVYLDAAATTPTDPRVADLVMRLMTEEFGNSGSRTHTYGAAALGEVNKARGRVARMIGASSAEVIFTSGATEADNLAILGLAPHARSTSRRHIVSTAIEHKAVLEPLEHLSCHGFEVTLISPGADGAVAAQDVLQAVRPDTILVSVMHANNETGVIQPVTEIAEKLPVYGPYFHVDAAQTVGKATADLRHPRIEMISISGHKFMAPKGIGALVVRRRNGSPIPIEALMFGGGQERALRPGTLATPLIAGLGLACELAELEQEQRARAMNHTKLDAIAALAGLGAIIHGTSGSTLPNILSFAVPGVDSEAVMVATKDLVAVSNGSACTSSRYEPSHVLLAMGLSSDIVAGTVRLSWTHQLPPVPWDHFVRRIDDLRF